MAFHDLSQDVQESFEFAVKGHNYFFRQPTTEEMKDMRKLEGEALEQFLLTFISKKDPSSPDFQEVSKQMINPEWINFKKMIEVEFGG